MQNYAFFIWKMINLQLKRGVGTDQLLGNNIYERYVRLRGSNRWKKKYCNAKNTIYILFLWFKNNRKGTDSPAEKQTRKTSHEENVKRRQRKNNKKGRSYLGVCIMAGRWSLIVLKDEKYFKNNLSVPKNFKDVVYHIAVVTIDNEHQMVYR